MAYEYDFFISYPASGTAGRWTRDYFIPTFTESFEDEAARAPLIYNFADRDAGITWPDEVSNALHRSRVLIAILTPPYFNKSAWCPAEWATMINREKITNFPAQNQDRRLIVPIVYSDGEHFPQEAKDIRHVDMKDFAFPDPAFRESAAFMKFRNEMRALARRVSPLLDIVPPWQDAWPALQRPPLRTAKVELPRL